jgi:predicted nucleic acid-binding protein
VFDGNVFLQAMISRRGPAAKCLEHALRGDAVLVVSPYVLAEVRALPTHPELRRFPSFTAERANGS